ncbi:MAG: hypothetical protein RRZ66_06635 [Bacteroidales bacterium]
MNYRRRRIRMPFAGNLLSVREQPESCSRTAFGFFGSGSRVARGRHSDSSRANSKGGVSAARHYTDTNSCVML